VAQLRPFRGVRYDLRVVGDLGAVVSAPYDIISPAAQRDYLARSPYNAVRLELPSDEPNDAAAHGRYRRAAAIYQQWLASGVLLAEHQAGFFLYEERFSDRGIERVRRSLLTPVRLADWREGIILPHEFTLSGPKQDRLNLLRATGVQFSPILALYDDPGDIGTVLDEVAHGEPVAELRLANGAVAAAAHTHRLWRIMDPARIVAIMRAFELLQIYIADGHHRYETALAYRDEQRSAGAGPDAPSEFVLMALVATDDPGICILPTHRLLRLSTVPPVTDLAPRLAGWFIIEEYPADQVASLLDAPYDRPTFVLLGLADGRAHRLTLREDIDLAALLPDVPPVLRALDTLVLQRLLLEPVFGLPARELETDGRIRFTRDPDEALHAYRAGEAQVVIFLRPTPLDQIRAVARAGERMPQKTTYFYPKPVTGLVFFDHQRAFAGHGPEGS